MKSLVIPSVLVSLIAAALLGGCNKSSTPTSQTEAPGTATAAVHDSDDVPLTEEQIVSLKQGVTSYSDALTKIKSYRDTIRDGIAADDPHKAHRPLDELDVVLEFLPTVARDNNIPKSQWENVNTSAQQLRDLFNKLHAQIDDGEQADYAAVSAEIESALTNLESAQATN